jgi:hypothetical protein
LPRLLSRSLGEKIADNLWRVQAKFPGAPIDREVILARVSDGRITVHNLIALGDAEMRGCGTSRSRRRSLIATSAHPR